MSDLTSRAYASLDQNSLLYPQNEVNLELNLAISSVNLFTGLIQTSIQVPGFSQPGQVLYQVPAGIMLPNSVQFEGRALEKESLRSISVRYRNWLTEITANSRPVRSWLPIDLSTFAIHPADSLGGRDIVVTGVADPAALSSSQSIDMDDQTVDMIVLMAVINLQFKEGGKIWADASTGYQKFIKLLKSRTMYEKIRFPRYFLERFERVEDAKAVGEEVGA